MIPHNKVIVTTRPAIKSRSTREPFGTRILNIPLTEIVPLEQDWNAVREFNPDILVFTSTVAGNIFMEASPLNQSANPKVVAIGMKTAEVLKKRFSDVCVPEDQSSSGIIDYFRSTDFGSRRIALFTSARSNRLVNNFLKENGYNFMQVDLYDARPSPGKEIIECLFRDEVLGIILTSSQEAEIFASIAGTYRNRKPLFAIGKTTADTMRRLGLDVSEPLGKSDLGGLAEEIFSKFQK